MKERKVFKIGLLILSSFLLVSTTLANGLPDQWAEINPADYGFEFNGLAPACSGAPGTPDDEFTFFVKGGKNRDKNKLVIFFQGGGACWDPMNCIVAPTYTQYQEEELWMFSEENEGKGIFDTTNKNNPFQDWGFVYIPYCTGDLFWGANDVDYTGDDVADIQHRGFVNFQAVLQYLKDHVRWPHKIFVTGSSAGSYGATMSFPYIKKAYPFSQVYLLGDAGNGVMGGTFVSGTGIDPITGEPVGGIYNWKVQVPDWIFPDGYVQGMTLKDIYEDIAAEYPWSKVAQYTTAWDATQTSFFSIMLNIENPFVWESGAPFLFTDWNDTMLSYAYDTAAASPNYRYYIAAGTDHTILMSPKFYTEQSAGGVPFSKWVKSMVCNPFGTHSHWLEGLWKNLECEDCNDPLMTSASGNAFQFPDYMRIEGAPVYILENPQRITMTGPEGYFEFNNLPVGVDATFVLKDPRYPESQTKTFVLPMEDLERVTFQTPNNEFYNYMVSNIEDFGLPVLSWACQVVTTVTVPGKSIYDPGAHGEAGATVKISPAIILPPDGPTLGPIYFNSDVQPDPTLTESSDDGGVLYINVIPGNPYNGEYYKEYTLTAEKEGVEFESVRIKCRPGVFVNASPPYGLQALPYDE